MFFINNKAEATENDKQVFGYDLKTGKSLQQVKDLIQFEDDLVRIVKELNFRKIKSDFQKMMRDDMKKVQTSKISSPYLKKIAIHYYGYLGPTFAPES